MINKNFTLDEFACPCCGKVEISTILIDKLQQLRDLINKPIIVTSGYRCSAYNKSVGGHNHSPHLTGEGADIQVKGMSPVTIAGIAQRILHIRIGIYSAHVHIDVRPANPSKYWLVKAYGQKPIYSKHEKIFAKFLKNNL